MTGRRTVTAVCVVHAPYETGLRRVPLSGIDKRPVETAVQVGMSGLAGDRQFDTANHGGEFKAVYTYGQDEADRWAAELGRPLPAGWFGENLRIAGASPTDAVIGERWRVGSGGLVLEVTGPRTPCRTFGVWADRDDWVARFTARGDCGAYLRVVEEGPVRAGDDITVEYRPVHGATVRDVFTGTAPERISAMLTGRPGLSPTVREKAERIVRRTRTGVGR